jgi:uncharacterized membrane protein YkvA (DUF1232 family)
MLLPRFLPAILRFCRLVWRLTFDKRVPLVLRLLVPAALLYALSPIDLLRDRIPVLGRLDDVLFVALALLFLVKLSPRHVVDEHSGRGRDSSRPQEANPSKVVEGSARLIDDDKQR